MEQAAAIAQGYGTGPRRIGSAGKKGIPDAPRPLRERLILAKCLREEEMGRLAAIEVAEKQKKLLDAAQVAKSHTRAGMVIRDGVLSIPGRVAALLVNQEDERVIERILTEVIREELTRIAHLASSDAA